MDEIFYIPGIVKMANLKIDGTRGLARKKLLCFIAAAEAADQALLGAGYPSSDNPAYCAALEAANAAGRTLRDYAAPIMANLAA